MSYDETLSGSSKVHPLREHSLDQAEHYFEFLVILELEHLLKAPKGAYIV